MSKKETAGGGLFRKLLWFLVFLFLLGNFCWEGEPLYTLVFSDDNVETVRDGVEDGVKNLKKHTGSGLKKIKNTSGEVIDKTGETVNELKDTVEKKVDKNRPSGKILKKERREMEQLIRKKTEGED